MLSDDSVKEAVEPYTRGLADILAYDVVSYRYVGDDPKTYVGRLASNVQAVDPSMVFRSHVEGYEEDLDHIDPSPDTYKLMNAVRELHERLSALEALQ